MSAAKKIFDIMLAKAEAAVRSAGLAEAGREEIARLVNHFALMLALYDIDCGRQGSIYVRAGDDLETGIRGNIYWVESQGRHGEEAERKKLLAKTVYNSMLANTDELVSLIETFIFRAENF